MDRAPETFGVSLIPCLIDSYAEHDPMRVWASIAKDADITKGFKDITYEDFAKAIDRACWWLQAKLGSSPAEFESFAYAGPKDLRYPIIAVAALKVGRQIVLPSPFATPEAQNHILKSTGARVYVHASSVKEKVLQVLGEGTKVESIEAPELGVWLCQGDVEKWQYKKTWEEAKDDPWIVFHTSGTTGLPKPVVYTNLMMAAMDAARTMPDADQENTVTQFLDKRWYSPLPTLHFVGMSLALQYTVYLNSTMVVGPAEGPPSAKITDKIIHYGKVAGAILPPSLVEDLCRVPTMLEHLRALDCLFFAGAPLEKTVGDKLAQHVTLIPGIGTTEAGTYFPEMRFDSDWDYYSFREAMGIQFEQRTPELYEMVFLRDPKYARWQQLFYVYPELDRFPTRDLWRQHPDKVGLWAYAGRIDDLIILSHGEGLYASQMEAELSGHDNIRSAIIGGEGRSKPLLIIEPVNTTVALRPNVAQNEIIDALWPTIREVNRLCSGYVELSRGLIILAKPEKPFVRTIKGNVSRRETLALYRDEIDQLYNHIKRD